jgi:DNA (cytosine-5)-methyltransferase 1
VDTTEITHISLCSGYGGIELGLKSLFPILRTVAYSEIEAFAIECLLARMESGQLDAAPIWSNLKSFHWESFRGMVDILSGGYPCQPFSTAGKRAGAKDPRHLWPYIKDGIKQMAPRICFFENVEGHISLGLSTVISDLEELGYQVAWGIFSAAECGAPHQRKRVFILANRNGQGLEGYWGHVAKYDSQGRQGADGYAWPSRPGQPQHAWEPPRVVEHSNGNRRQRNVPRDVSEQDSNRQDDRILGAADSMGNSNSFNRSTSPEGWEYDAKVGQAGGGEAEPALGREADGVASGLDYAQLCVSCDNRTDELRLLGNGVVPATVTLAFRTLLDAIEPSVHH